MIVCGDARRIPLGDESVQVCVTSPPYWGLRKYAGNQDLIWEASNGCAHEWVTARDTRHKRSEDWKRGAKQVSCEGSEYNTEPTNICGKCEAWRGAYGLEPTVEAYVAHTVEILREVRRVLRKDGVCFWNVGDSYCSTAPGSMGDKLNKRGILSGITDECANARIRFRPPTPEGLKPKDLCLIPMRVVLAAQADGWWVRSVIIWCLSGGTWLYARTQKGDMPIMLRDLARLRPETVKLWNGEKWTQVLGWSKSVRKADELEIVLRSGERFSCTPTHKFPTTDGLKTAAELKVGDVLKRVRLPEPGNPLKPEHIDVDVAWLVGLYIAEGSHSEDTIQIAGHAKEEARWERLKAIAPKYGGAATRTVDGNKMNIRLYGKVLNALIDQFVSGKTAKDKCFAPVVWKYSNEFLMAALDGYLSGDGHWDQKNLRWRLGFTRNYNLERDLRVLAARLGIRIVLKPGFVKYKGKRRPTFRGEIRSGNSSRTKAEEIMKIRKARCREVFDVGVADEPHLFAMASGILTHNSKPNPMPESVTDRPTDAYEHILMLTKSAKYFWDAEAVKETSSTPMESTARQSFGGPKLNSSVLAQAADWGKAYRDERTPTRNLRNVWTFATQPYSGWTVNFEDADYVGGDGKPYTASKDCPIHAHLADRRRISKSQGDAQLDRKSLHNLGSEIDRAVGPSIGHVAKTSMNNERDCPAANALRKTHGSMAANKMPSVQNSDDEPISDGEMPSRTSRNSMLAKPILGSPDYLVHGNSRSASENNNGSHRKGRAVSTNGPYNVFSQSLSRIDGSEVGHAQIGPDRRTYESSISEDSVSDEKEKGVEAENLGGSEDIPFIKNSCKCRECQVSHFATFPEELPRRCILAASSAKGGCRFCGAPWERIVKSTTRFEGGSGKAGTPREEVGGKWEVGGENGNANIKLGPCVDSQTIGWRPTCECRDQHGKTVPCICLDPFGGSGTTGRVAIELNRRAVLLDLAYGAEYAPLAEKRTSEVQVNLF